MLISIDVPFTSVPVLVEAIRRLQECTSVGDAGKLANILESIEDASQCARHDADVAAQQWADDI